MWQLADAVVADACHADLSGDAAQRPGRHEARHRRPHQTIVRHPVGRKREGETRRSQLGSQHGNRGGWYVLLWRCSGKTRAEICTCWCERDQIANKERMRMANIGYIGLGAMGSQMVDRLLEKGHTVTGDRKSKRLNSNHT